MFFRNTADSTVTFDIDSIRYSLPPGKLCDIEKRYTYIVKSRGLPLEEVSLMEAAQEQGSVVEPKPVPRRRTAIRGVASGDTVTASDDKDDLQFVPGATQLRTADLVDTDSNDDDTDESSQVPQLAIPNATQRALAARNRKAAS